MINSSKGPTDVTRDLQLNIFWHFLNRKRRGKEVEKTSSIITIRGQLGEIKYKS